ncbi:hypothetical protein GEMRC1_009298 [Eukaryota sp. GEM-RC1]
MFTSFKDKVYAAMHSDVAKSAIKASNHDDIVKEKHVRNLIISSHSSSRVSEVISSLALRLNHKESWIVLKSLIILHRLIKEGSSQFLSSAALSASSLIFHHSFSDPTSPQSLILSQFVRGYSKYLEELLLVCKQNRNASSRVLASKVLRDNHADYTSSISSGPKSQCLDLFRTSPVQECSKQADFLLDILDSALSIDYESVPHGLQITRIATGMMLTDTLKVSGALIAYNRNLLDVYFQLTSVDHAQGALNQYKKFASLLERMVVLDCVAVRFRVELPKSVSVSITQDMELYIENLRRGEECGGSLGLDLEIPDVESVEDAEKNIQDSLFGDFLSKDEASLFDDDFFKDESAGQNKDQDQNQESKGQMGFDDEFFDGFGDGLTKSEDLKKSDQSSRNSDLLDLF